MNADGRGFGWPALPGATGCWRRSPQGNFAPNHAGAMAPARPTSRRRFPVAGSGKSLPPLQNVKEQARERRTEATLPLFGGTATFILIFIFHLNSPQTTRTHRSGTGKNFRPSFFRAGGCFAVLTPVGGALFRKFLTTDFPDCTDGRPVAFYPCHP